MKNLTKDQLLAMVSLALFGKLERPVSRGYFEGHGGKNHHISTVLSLIKMGYAESIKTAKNEAILVVSATPLLYEYFNEIKLVY